MKRVLTYGTFDLLHRGHINILKSAAEQGDELYVGVSSDEFNELKGKKTFQSFEERTKEVEKLPFVTKVFKEDNWEQKENDVKEYNIDIFSMGSDWEGEFDYLEEKGLCKVKIFDRTEGVSSSELKEKKIEIALITYEPNLKYLEEAFESLTHFKDNSNIIVNIYDNGNEDGSIREAYDKWFLGNVNFNFIKILKNNGKGKVVRDILTNSTSDYVQIMNDDDIIIHEKFVKNINNILGKECDIAFLNYTYLNDKNSKKKDRKIIKGESRILDKLPKKTWTLDLNAIYNINFIKENVKISNEVTNYSDVYINCAITAKTNNIYYLDATHYLYRVKRKDKKNVSSSKSIKKDIEKFQTTFLEMVKIKELNENIYLRMELMFLAVVILSKKNINYKKLISKVEIENSEVFKKLKKSFLLNIIFWKGYNPIIWIYKWIKK